MNAQFILAFTLLCTIDAAMCTFTFSCKGTDIKLDADCLKEMKERSAKEPDACFLACKLEKVKGVVDGKVDLDAVNKWIEGELPKAAQTAAKDGIKKCAEGVSGLSKADKCKSYEKLSVCKVKAFTEACKD